MGNDRGAWSGRTHGDSVGSRRAARGQFRGQSALVHASLPAGFRSRGPRHPGAPRRADHPRARLETLLEQYRCGRRGIDRHEPAGPRGADRAKRRACGPRRCRLPLADLLDWLHERTDRTLPTLGAITTQTISGAISTGTHGSGRQSLSHYVARIRAAVFDAASGRPAIREFSEGPELEAARCGLGCMGVILAVELPTVRKFKIAETVRIRQSLDEILGLYADQPLTQFFWAPYSWVWLTFERRPLGEPRLSSWDVRAAMSFDSIS